MSRKTGQTPDRKPEINPDRKGYAYDPVLAAVFRDYGCPLISNFYAFWAFPVTPEEDLDKVCDEIEEALIWGFPHSLGRVN